MTVSLNTLRQKIEWLKQAGPLSKAAAAESAVHCMMTILEQLNSRIQELEIECRRLNNKISVKKINRNS
jgi:hypothetical protein